MRILDWAPSRKLIMWLGPRVMPARYFEYLYAQKPDPWACATRDYELRKYARTLEAISSDWTRSVLELGCGEGVFTRMLAPKAKALLAVDVSETALSRGRDRCADQPHVAFERTDVVRDPLPSGFSLVVAAEVLYSLGSSEKCDRVCRKILDALESEGRLLTINGSADAGRLNEAFVRAGARIITRKDHPDPVRAFTIVLLQAPT